MAKFTYKPIKIYRCRTTVNRIYTYHAVYNTGHLVSQISKTEAMFWRDRGVEILNPKGFPPPKDMKV
jgi:hypothetical protein